MACEETCCNCGDDIGPHHLCTDCLEGLSGTVDESPQGDERGRLRDVDQGGVSPTLNAFDNATETRATVIMTSPVGVRRLTPRECERLQGFPDNWTDGQADSHRYKQMGNAVTVPVVHYVATLIDSAGIVT